MSVLGALLLGAASAGFVRVFFFVMRSEWPASYELVRTSAQARQRQNFLSFVALRFGPVVLLAVFALVTTDRLRLKHWWTTAGFLAVEVGFTSLLALVRVGRAEVIARRANVTLYHVGVGAGVVAATLLGVWLRTFRATKSLIPPPSELPSALWTGLFVVVVSIALRDFVSKPPSIAACRGDACEVNVSYARDAAATRDCDRDLIEAIVVVESIQRPAWIRWLERLKGRVRPSGTYGVAQVSAARPVSDSESIDELCLRFAGYYPLRTADGVLRRAPLEARLEQHNDDDAFISMVIDEYEELTGFAVSRSEQAAHDRRPMIEILDIRRKGSQLVLKGSAFIGDDQIALVVVEAGGQRTDVIELMGDPALRRTWGARVGVAADNLAAWPLSASETKTDDSQSAEVDLQYQ